MIYMENTNTCPQCGENVDALYERNNEFYCENCLLGQKIEKNKANIIAYIKQNVSYVAKVWAISELNIDSDFSVRIGKITRTEEINDGNYLCKCGKKMDEKDIVKHVADVHIH